MSIPKTVNYWYLLIVVAALFLTPRLAGIGYDMVNSDEIRWHRRTISFMEAIKQQNWAQTYQNYQPGVVLMWINGLSYQINNLWSMLENSTEFPKIHAWSQTFIVLTLFILFLFQVILLRQLYSDEVSLFFGFFIAVEPYLIGIDRWVHLTSLETYFGFTAFLFLKKYLSAMNTKWLILCGVFVGFAVLAKLTSLILVGLFVFLLLMQKKWKSALILAIFFSLTFVLLFPAMWVAPVSTLSKLVNAIGTAVSEDDTTSNFSRIYSALYYFVILALKLSPITLLLFVFSKFKKTLTVKDKLNKSFHLAYEFFIFVALFLVLTFSVKKIDRYVIILFPYILLSVAIFVSQLKLKLKVFIVSLTVVFFGSVVLMYYPVFSAYYSPLFGGQTVAIKLGYFRNTGEYFADAAFYLNSFGRQNKVYVPDNTDTFRYFYKGTTVYNFDTQVDYVVTSLNSERPKPMDNYCSKLVKRFNSVFVFSCR